MTNINKGKTKLQKKNFYAWIKKYENLLILIWAIVILSICGLLYKVFLYKDFETSTVIYIDYGNTGNVFSGSYRDSVHRDYRMENGDVFEYRLYCNTGEIRAPHDKCEENEKIEVGDTVEYDIETDFIRLKR